MDRSARSSGVNRLKRGTRLACLVLLTCLGIIAVILLFKRGDGEDPVGPAVITINTTQEGPFLVCLTPAEDILVVAGWDGTIQLFSFPEGCLLGTFDAHPRYIEAILISGDGEKIYSTDGDSIRIWDLPRRALRQELTLREKRIRSIALSPTEALLAMSGVRKNTGGWDTSIWLWPLVKKSDAVLLAKPIQGTMPQPVFSRDGTLLAFANFDPSDESKMPTSSIHLWNVQQRMEVGKYVISKSDAAHAQFLGNSHTLAVAGGRGREGIVHEPSIEIWDCDKGVRTGVLEGFHALRIEGLVSSSDGKVLASGDGEGYVGVWDTVAMKRINGIKIHEPGIRSMAMTKDAKWLITSCWDSSTDSNHGLSEVKIWKVLAR